MDLTDLAAQGPLEMDALDLSAEEIERRFRWARRRGHPRYPWPEVPVGVWRAWLAEITRVTSQVLREARGAPVLEPVAGPALGLSVAAFSSGMGPLLGHWLEAGRLDAPPRDSRILDLHLRHGRARARRIVDEARLLLDTLQGAGLTSTVLKGTDTGRRFFPEPGARPSSDVDVLVEAGRIVDAESALAAAGYRCLSPRDVRKPKSDWASPEQQEGRLRSLHLTHAQTPVHVDLHATLDRNMLAVSTVRFGEGPERYVRPFPDLHPKARVLDEPLLSGFLAIHASAPFMSLTLIRLVEMVFVVRTARSEGTLDWGEMEGLLRRTGAIRFVFPAFYLTERLAPGTVDPDFLSEIADAAPRRIRTVLEHRGPDSIQPLEDVSVRERLMWAHGPWEFVQTIRELILPTGIRSLSGVFQYSRERMCRVVRRRI